MPRTTFTLLVCALLAAVAATGAAHHPPVSADGIVAAPPPAAYCRATPDAGWPTVDAASVPDLSPYQDYRTALGMVAGATGAGVAIADVEYEWAAGHLELAAHALAAAPANGLDPAYQARDHGTAVLAVLGGTADGLGVSGLAPDAQLLPVSPFVAGDYDPVAGINRAANRLGPGDVMLIELQALVPRAGGGTALAPIEYYTQVRAAIRAAVDDGIIVVEPAGNGDLDIGALGQSDGAPWLVGQDHPLHSGAIMVGAGGTGSGIPPTPDLDRVVGSNWGSRVDVQGPGAGVVTAGYADLSAPGAGADRAYTACFDGTSSASAAVAGMIAALQSAHLARTGGRLTPAQVRTLLVEAGTPQAPSGAATPIGPRPNLSAILERLGAAAPPASPPAPPAAEPPPAAPSVEEALPAPFEIDISQAARRAALAPAVRGAKVTRNRARRALVVRFTGLRAGAIARVGARRVPIARGRIVIRGLAPRRILVTVAGRPTAGLRAVKLRIVVPRRGAIRVVRVP